MTLVEDVDVVGVHGRGEPVGDEDDRVPFLGQGPQPAERVDLRMGVEGAGGLVDQQERCLPVPRPG
ncbi:MULTISPECIES: hypothetical protein [unclassified Streptomyces]|nr:hypothetical protein [Streptomyces sp. DH-12]